MTETISNKKNMSFYCQDSIRDELRSKNLFEGFHATLDDPRIVPPIDKAGLKKLTFKPPKLATVSLGNETKTYPIKWEVKTMHGTHRLLAIEIPSDSKEFGKQGKLIAPIILQDLHSTADEKQLDSILKSKIFAIRSPAQKAEASDKQAEFSGSRKKTKEFREKVQAKGPTRDERVSDVFGKK